MAKFVVAVKRDRRNRGITARQVGSITGVTLVGDSNPNRVIVEATLPGIAEARQKFGESMVIEPVIEHGLAKG